MGFIRVRLEGHKKNGGYLTIMREMSYEALKREETLLTDGKTIFLPNGPQTIRFDPVGLYKREKAIEKTVRARQTYRSSQNDYDGSKFDNFVNAVSDENNLPEKIHYTLTVESNTLLTIVVTSDYKGDIIGDPQFFVSSMTEEEVKEMEKKREEERILQEKRNAEAAQRRKEEEERILQSLKQRARSEVKKSILLFILAIIMIIVASKSTGIITLIGFGGLALGIWAIRIFIKNISRI